MKTGFNLCVGVLEGVEGNQGARGVDEPSGGDRVDTEAAHQVGFPAAPVPPEGVLTPLGGAESFRNAPVGFHADADAGEGGKGFHCVGHFFNGEARGWGLWGEEEDDDGAAFEGLEVEGVTGEGGELELKGFAEERQAFLVVCDAGFEARIFVETERLVEKKLFCVGISVEDGGGLDEERGNAAVGRELSGKLFERVEKRGALGVVGQSVSPHPLGDAAEVDFGALVLISVREEEIKQAFCSGECVGRIGAFAEFTMECECARQPEAGFKKARIFGRFAERHEELAAGFFLFEDVLKEVLPSGSGVRRRLTWTGIERRDFFPEGLRISGL